METRGQKTPTENNHPEENPEDVKHTNPQTTHPQPNWIPQTTQPIITAPKLLPHPPPQYLPIKLTSYQSLTIRLPTK